MTNTHDVSDELNLAELIKILKKNWLLFTTLFMVIFSAAAVYSIKAPKVYESRALVMITSQDQFAALFGNTFPRPDIKTEREIFLSASVLGPVYQKFSYSNFMVSIQPIKDTSVMEIKVETDYAKNAMDVANAIAESYIKYTADVKKTDAKIVNEFITEQIDTLRADYDDLLIQQIELKNNKNQTFEEQFKIQTLTQQLNVKDRLINQLLQKREEISIISQQRIGNVRVIQDATIPAAPSKPNVPLNMLIGAILAFLISFGAIYLKENPGKFS